ncbi:MAG: ATP-binding protein [Syntrophobacteraceae bacterium]
MEQREPTREELFEKIRFLEERVWEAEQAIEAIQSGEVDALVIQKPEGEQLYTLTGADHGYRVLVESVSEGALILSSDDSIYYCNRTLGEMLGLPIQKIVSTKLDSYVVSEGRAPLMELIEESRSCGAAKGEFLMMRNDGTLLPVNVSLNCLSMVDFEGVCAVITDLTQQKQVEEELRRHRTGLELLVSERTADLQQEIIERKRAEGELRKSRDELELRVCERTAELVGTVTRLEQLNEELQEFAFIASHDLQEPLRKIQAFGSILIRKHKESLDPEGRDYMDRITKAANRMSELLRALLSYSRSGTSQLNYEPVSLTEVAEDAASDLEILINRVKGTVEISELPTVEADAPLLRQLFQNFIGNSIKYRKESEPPIVKIYGKIAGETCRIMIEDNGIGFDECYSHKIFKPFERLHGRNAPYTGTGMGLAICKKIVNRHAGEITVRSIPEGGTTFIVSLPIAQEKKVEWKGKTLHS